MAELACCDHHTGSRNRTESFWKGLFKAFFRSDRNHSWICSCAWLWNGGFFFRINGKMGTVQPMHFGIKFEPSSCVAIAVLFAISSIQAIGDFSATTTGGMDRMPTDEELSGGIIGYGVSNIVCAFFSGLPTATYSQNVGIVSSTKVVAKRVFGIAAMIMLVAGIMPKIAYILLTNSSRTCGCSRNGCDTGKCSTCTAPCMGNNHFR